MRVRRTGARRGQSPTWYISADQENERAAIRAGLLQNCAPDQRWIYVLAWGYSSKAAAEIALSEMQSAVAAAILSVRVRG